MKKQPVKDAQNIVCPFCGKEGFDLIEFKGHLTWRSVFTGNDFCPKFSDCPAIHPEKVEEK